MGHSLNRHDEPILIAVSKPVLTEFGIHNRLESCVWVVFKRGTRLALRHWVKSTGWLVFGLLDKYTIMKNLGVVVQVNPLAGRIDTPSRVLPMSTCERYNMYVRSNIVLNLFSIGFSEKIACTVNRLPINQQQVGSTMQPFKMKIWTLQFFQSVHRSFN